jgi:urease beta subunit
MTGECVLLDIPLAIRVNLLNFSGSRVFATGSLSSYIMLNEAYRFDTDNSYGGTQAYSYDENTGTSHFMSNAGLSIGYEYDLNSNFSIRFEPQIKIPIREVGVTNVRLFSLGSFFSLSYNL